MSITLPLTDALAIDCEMVGVGPKGCKDMLARVSVVNEYTQCIYNEYVYPREKVTDYRTWISGIEPRHILKHGKDFVDVREAVRSMIKGRWLVGHALKHDLSVLALSHPPFRIRDTATYPPFIQMNRNRTPSLKWLAWKVLGWNIQDGAHSSVEDAKACMEIYKVYEDEWEGYSSDESEYDDDSSSDSSDY